MRCAVRSSWLALASLAMAVPAFAQVGAPATWTGFSITPYIGVLGASTGIRIGRLLAINLGAEDYLYNASFDVNGAKTAERKQHDLRFTGGIRVPFIGT